MRGGTNWRSIIAAPEGHWAFSFLELQNLDGEWVNLGNLAVGERDVDFLNSYDLEDDIDRNTHTFSATLRGSVGAYSLMPFRTDSPLNADGDGLYQPFVDLHIPWRLWVCFTSRGTFPEGPEDYRERARGIIDRIDLSFSRDEIRLQGRGPEADFIDDLVVCDETTPKVYAAGPVADVLQAMLDDRYGVATYTLVVDSSAPSTFIDEITYTEPFSFWKVFSDVAAVGTGIVRFLYDDSDNLAIHLFTPNRSADSGDEDWTVGPDEYEDIDNGLDLSTVANYIVARFINASGAVETVTSPTVDPSITPTASTTRYGIKTAVITLASNIGLSDATRVQAMIDAIRSDRELPILGQVVKGSGLWFGELWDYVGTTANPVLYNEDQAGGVVGWRESARNGVIDNTFTIAGKPKGRYATWLEIGSVGGVAAVELRPTISSLALSFYEANTVAPSSPAGVQQDMVLGDDVGSVRFEITTDPTFATTWYTVNYTGGPAGTTLTQSFGFASDADRDQVYYARATPFSGPTIDGVEGIPVVQTSLALRRPTDTATVTFDLSTDGQLKANVVSGAVSPGGAAGGVLSGTYPNPGFATDPFARANHTGTQAASTISDFASASRAQTEAELVAGTNITITPASSGATRTLTIAASGGAALPSATTGALAYYNGSVWVALAIPSDAASVEYVLGIIAGVPAWRPTAAGSTLGLYPATDRYPDTSLYPQG